MKTYLYRASNLKSTITFLASVSWRKSISGARRFMRFIHLMIIIRECSSTLYVGLAHTAPPTNTNFRITFLLTRLLDALYEDLPL